MKKILVLLIILVVGVSGVFAQVDFDSMESSFSKFSTDIAESLPFASTIGLNWSDATVRSLPHFGVGVTVGAVSLPEEAFTLLATTMGFPIPAEITDLGLGVPLPVYTIDVRLGGILFPFDVGAKLGYIPPDALADMAMTANYTLAGFDIRTPILKQNLLLPSIALSVGYNYLNAGVGTSISSGMGSGIDLSGYSLSDITFSDPEASFQMESNVIDAKLQVSKSLLIFTPYVGAGYAYGWSNAGGGVAGSVLYGGTAITATDIDAINTALALVGESELNITSEGFLVSAASEGGSFRAFGGLSINLFILKLDLNAMYNVSTESLGASANIRIAF